MHIFSTSTKPVFSMMMPFMHVEVQKYRHTIGKKSARSRSFFFMRLTYCKYTEKGGALLPLVKKGILCNELLMNLDFCVNSPVECMKEHLSTSYSQAIAHPKHPLKYVL